MLSVPSELSEIKFESDSVYFLISDGAMQRVESHRGRTVERLGVFHHVVELVGEIGEVRCQDTDLRSVVFENLIGTEQLPPLPA
jgi:hypothetical protein